MKKLGKKLHNAIETVEAYCFSCDNCGCGCDCAGCSILLPSAMGVQEASAKNADGMGSLTSDGQYVMEG